jgi:hypothetical protein
MNACSTTGFFRIYRSKAVEPHQPALLISSGTAPASAMAVAPPACIDCPAIVVPKYRRRQAMNQERKGTVPLALIQSCGWKGKRVSRDRV